MKKLEKRIDTEFLKGKEYYNIFDIARKVDEHTDWINLQEKKDDFLDAIDDFKPRKPPPKDYFDEFHKWCDETENQPKKLEVKHDPDFNFTYFSNTQMEVIKKVFLYGRHRLIEHHNAGIKSALSKEDIGTFYKILKKL